MTKQNSPYDFDTHDVAVDMACEIRLADHREMGLSPVQLIHLIESKLDALVQDGKIRVFEKRHHVT